MSQQTTKNSVIFIYGTTLLSLALAGMGLAYYISEDDRRVKQRRQARRIERDTLKTLEQFHQQQLDIDATIQSVESSLHTKCDDKTFKQWEYTLAHSNEQLLQLMEKLDAIRPLTLIVNDNEREPTEFERSLVETVKNKKRQVIGSIGVLFPRLDEANRVLKEQGEERTKEENARKESERKTREEQERVAQEEALRRQNEDEKELKAEHKHVEEEERKAQDQAYEVVEREEEQKEQETATQRSFEVLEIEEEEEESKDQVEDIEEVSQEEFILDATEQVKKED